MPELPEVEIVARALQKAVGGRLIRSAELLRPRLAPGSTPARFAAHLRECRINHVHRRGKNILFDLDNGRTLLTHLRMSGRFMLLSPDDDDPKFTHALFHLDQDSRLVFEDQRHFGLMKVIKTSDLAGDASIANLAPEPFSDEFSADYLAAVLSGSARSLKEFLLDQTKVCGLGNIYAAEAMFHAGLSPRRRAKNVPGKRVERLFESIRNVLSEALAVGEMKTPDPVNIGEGVYGNGITAEWVVYEREGRPCAHCDSVIKRIRQGARSTYYCPSCQR
jgi:formamidopyrimidine-DNA glycosylase